MLPLADTRPLATLPQMPGPIPILTLSPTTLIGQAKSLQDPCPLKDAAWYTVPNVSEGLSYTVDAGSLAKAQALVIDLLLDGTQLAVFQLALHEPPEPTPPPARSPAARNPRPLPPRVFSFTFGLLNQCSARLRVPMKAADQNQWAFYREGACLKRMAGGDRVDPAKVNRITLTVLRKSPAADQPVRFAATPLLVTSNFPDALFKPVLPRDKLLDQMGQSTLHEWPT